MNYMLLIYHDESQARPLDPHDETMELCGGLADRLKAKGQLIGGSPLLPTSTATCLRLRDGNRILTDGPFAETREQLAGYLLVKAENLDEALAIAAEHPVAKYGTVEVRRLFDMPDLPVG